MKKKIIATLMVLIALTYYFPYSIYAMNDTTFDIPQSSTNPEEGINQLLNGETTVTSDDDESSVNSEQVQLGTTETQKKNIFDSIVSLLSLVPSVISRVLAAVANGQEPNFVDSQPVSHYFTIGDLLTNKYPLFDINVFEKTPDGPNSGLSNQIKSNASIWYVAIRNIAVVGTFLTLIYIAIRMLISTTAGDSAKYKKMLMSWAVGLSLMVTIQFILIFMMTISTKLVQFISTAIESDTDTIDMEKTILMNISKFTAGKTLGGKLFYLVLEIVLIYYELKFFIMYLFRVLRIFIMIIISPLICMTYSLDSVSDGRAQGFNKWFKEIAMEIFLQPIHLIIYVVFVYSAGEIAKVVPLLGVVFLIALDQAEKIIRNALKIKGKGLRDIKLLKIKGKK